MIIYVYPKCSTCQNALRFLEQKKVEVTIQDIVKEPPPEEELESMLAFQQGNMTKLLNTSGMLYREMELSQKIKEMSVAQVLSLLNQHGMLIKRPFLLAETFGLTGFNEEKWSMHLL